MLPYSYNTDSLIDRIMMKRWSFLAVFALTFILTYLFLVAVDLVPEPPKPESLQEPSDSVTLLEEADPGTVMPVTVFDDMTQEIAPQLPRSIYFKSLDKEVSVLNPVSRTVADLDEALLSGAVRHPDSARVGQEGNVIAPVLGTG